MTRNAPARELERGLIGSVLMDQAVLGDLTSNVIPDDFTDDETRTAFEACISIDERGESIDMHALMAETQRKGTPISSASLALWLDVAPYGAGLEQALATVAGRARTRRIATAAAAILTEARTDPSDPQSFADKAEGTLLEATRSKAIGADVIPVCSEVNEVVHEIEAMQDHGGVTGIETGLSDFDAMTSGLQRGDLIIMAGRPSMGKSALATCIGAHAAFQNGLNVLILSLEMTRKQIIQRLIASEGRVDLSRLRSGRLGGDDWPRVFEAARYIQRDTMAICDRGGMNIFDARGRSRRMSARQGLDLLIVDYLQLMRGRTRKPETRDLEIGQISGGLKALAKELDIPVIALSQLNRSLESRADKRPILSDLRESGNLEQDADIISFIYRDEVYNKETSEVGIAELIVGKQRNGPTGTVRLRFAREFTRFENLAQREGY